MATPYGSAETNFGRIFDEFGEPLSDVMVQPMRYQFVQGKRTLVGAGRQSTTDDNGEFSFPPGPADSGTRRVRGPVEHHGPHRR